MQCQKASLSQRVSAQFDQRWRGGDFATVEDVCGICGVVSMEAIFPRKFGRSISAMTDRLIPSRSRRRRRSSHPVVRVRPPAAGDHRSRRRRAADGNEDGSVWIVFNGEIYNHRALRRDLEARGHRFRTHSDTEAIVHAYEEFGDACVERLEGMFAFAIADDTRAACPAGARSAGQEAAVLCHARRRAALRDSEIKAIKASPAWNGELDLDAIEGYLSLGYFVAPHTAYRHVHKLEPAHTLAMRRPRIDDPQVLGHRAVRHRRSRPRRAARRSRCAARRRRSRHGSRAKCRSARSSRAASIPAWSSRTWRKRSAAAGDRDGRLRRSRRTTSSKPAALTAARFHTRHHTAIVDPRLDDVLDPIVRPSTSRSPTRRRSRPTTSARWRVEHVTVALSGDGGDEAFGGYDWRYMPHGDRGNRRVSSCPGNARTQGGGVARRTLAALPRVAPAAAAGQRARKSRARSGGGVLRRPVLPEAARCPRAARHAAATRPG